MGKVVGSLVIVAAAIVPLASCSTGAGPRATFAGGEQFHVDKYRGKVLLLEFLSTACAHCVRSSQEIELVYREMKPRGFEVVGIALNAATPAMVEAFTGQLGLTFPVAIGDEDSARAFLDFPEDEIFYVPRLIFIDRNGAIRETYQGGDAFITTNEQDNVRQLAGRLLAE